jgi:hypothetical protein
LAAVEDPKRNGRVFGRFIAEHLELRNGTLYAMSGRNAIGCAASGPDLSGMVSGPARS